MTTRIKSPKKLIEVALPLDDINTAAAREKSIRFGHPSTLHVWWARRPLAAARAVLFAQLVNDPGGNRGYGPGMTKAQAQTERERLFGIIRRLVLWENSTNETVLREARDEIVKSWKETCELNRNHERASELFDPARLPAFHDPFAGGGAIPLEAQRLGLESFATDLNPVAVLINKAMIELAPQFSGRAPVGPLLAAEQRDLAEEWPGALALAEDVGRYGAWVRAQAFLRIGHLYPKATLPPEMGGGEAQVIAWLWARTVKSPNPAFAHVDVPLASSFILAHKADKEFFVSPVVEGDTYRFEVKSGTPPPGAEYGTKAPGRGANFVCILSNTPISGDYIKAEGHAGRIGARLMAVVAEGNRTRLYLSPTPEAEAIAQQAEPGWRPSGDIPPRLSGGTCVPYGLKEWGDIFTPRQLATLNTLSDLVAEAREKIKADAMASGQFSDNDAGTYADAVATFLGLAISRLADRNNSLCSWDAGPVSTKSTTGGSARTASLRNLFARQAIPMVWDFGEANPFSDSGGGFNSAFAWVEPAVRALYAKGVGHAQMADAQTQSVSENKVVSTDPPYYDNIFYADLSDFFYVWLRRSLRPIHPTLFNTISSPKAEELVATAHRHGGKDQAEAFFLQGMTEAMRRLAENAHPAFPATIYYAFKQSDTTDIGTGNTGWETFLEAVLQAGFSIGGTWPMRTELSNRMIGRGSNALASSIVLVCRKRDAQAATISRRDFLRELKEEMSEAVELMIGGAEGVSPVAPVDLAQAVIGPGMAVFSKYSAVLEADGSRMSVHSALTLINRMLLEGGDEFDADTHFCLAWFEEMGWAPGDFGKADVLARAKGTAVDGVREGGVIEASGGKVRLLKTSEYPADWEPRTDTRIPVWEALHQMIRALQSEGESSAGFVLSRLPERAEPIRSLGYRLYTLCERKGWAEEARGYNELITSWLGIEAASHEAGRVGSQVQLDI
ncbi:MULTISPECIES: DUF1156 domain-containing protein [Paraburkholderia]|uniref:DUF1156 domain-containing protein n=1 Tax=Paraburkholderia madseniana TaxID=2599607 RepID=A0AAP5BP50_9BURK|nr:MULTISPECIES: DUF1156 domain-containing protein [Paraburkholderia]MCX4151757.1 DUF1156 domain-containing protein [Paraburkholderia madseniana]MDN7154684.1 DUF1156 domain-containing protein [Paraburkholderia sp. WS6]MDQ6413567.1 DUF1156 domain-containing protein [Paraburkholderia madseniana]